MGECLSSQTLRQFLDGACQGAEAYEFQKHVDNCPQCLALLEQFSEDAELSAWRRSAPRSLSEPELDRLMHELLSTSQNGSNSNRSALDSVNPEPLCLSNSQTAAFEFPGYVVETELGRGGMGIVFKARDLTLGRMVAIKVLRPDRNTVSACRRRFLNEARATASVENDHVVNLYAVTGLPDASPFLVMEYVDGPTLRQRIEQAGALSPREAAEYCAQVGSGLAAAHSAGLIHRDVKPGNILLDLSSRRAKLMDFGLARAVDAAGLTLDGELLGTPAYMSPEQIRRPDAIDRRSDVYGLGATLYEALTGIAPFRGTTHGVIEQVLTEEPRRPRLLNEAIPQDLETICLHALAKEPAARYRSASAMVDDLRRWLRGEPILARPPGTLGRALRWSKRNPRVALLSGIVAALMLFATVGSMIFAGLLTQEKIETVAALGQAEANAQAARDAESQALANAAEARELGAAALDAHSSLVFKVQEQLGNKAGTLPLRKQLLETALAGLQKIVKLPHGPESERSIQAAYDRMADVLGALGRSEEAWRSCQTACDLAQRRADREPGDEQAQRDLALAFDKLGTLRYVEHDFTGALAQFTKSHDIRDRLVERNPTPQHQRELAVSFNKLADVHLYTNKVDQAEEDYKRALDLTKKAASADSTNTTYKRDLRFSYGRLVMLYEGRCNLKEAARFESLALQSAKELAELDSANTQWQHDFGYTSALAGTLDLKQDHVAQALEHFGTYLTVSEKLHGTDKENIQWARDVGLASLRLAEGQVRAGELPAARLSIERATSIFEQILAKDPANVPVRIDLAIAWLRRAELMERLSQYHQAALDCANSLKALDFLDKDGKLKGQMLTGLRDTAKELQTVFAFADENGRFENKSPPTSNNPWILAYWSLAQARRENLHEAIEGSDLVCQLAVSNAAHMALAARVYAICAVKPSSDRSKIQTKSLRDQCIDKSIKALAETLRLSPTYEWQLEPDFDSIRKEQGYRKLFSGQ